MQKSQTLDIKKATEQLNRKLLCKKVRIHREKERQQYRNHHNERSGHLQSSKIKSIQDIRKHGRHYQNKKITGKCLNALLNEEKKQ